MPGATPSAAPPQRLLLLRPQSYVSAAAPTSILRVSICGALPLSPSAPRVFWWLCQGGEMNLGRRAGGLGSVNPPPSLPTDRPPASHATCLPRAPYCWVGLATAGFGRAQLVGCWLSESNCQSSSPGSAALPQRTAGSQEAAGSVPPCSVPPVPGCSLELALSIELQRPSQPALVILWRLWQHLMACQVGTGRAAGSVPPCPVALGAA